MGFISFYRDISAIDYIIGNIDTTLKGQFATINDDISNEAGDIAFITPEGIEFWDDEAERCWTMFFAGIQGIVNRVEGIFTNAAI